MAPATQDRGEFELSHGLPLRASDVQTLLSMCEHVSFHSYKPFYVVILISQMSDLKVQSGDVTCQISLAQAEPGLSPDWELVRPDHTQFPRCHPAAS